MVIEQVAKWLPNKARPAGTVVDTVILHATAGSSWLGAFKTLWDRGLSYHYVIEDQRDGNDGLVHKCVPYSKVAYHAGLSVGPQGKWCNRYSVGVCFINANNGSDPYSEAQYQAAHALIEQLKTVLPLKYLTTHAIVSPGRKTDPLGFPVRYLASDTGLQFWRP